MRLLAAALLLLATPAIAQEAIVPPEARAQQNSILTTKPAPAGQSEQLPWLQQPVPVAPPGSQAMPAQIPFGKSTASQYQPIQETPHTATAVPVENVDAIQASEPAPPTPAAPGADPVNENPAEPTELTAPIFLKEEHAPPRIAIVRVLNKVTARAQTIELKPAKMETVGKLQVQADHCQFSAGNSLADAAALFTIAEMLPGEEKAKPIFSGWMYQSSPSVSALEHPVYDVMLMGCKDVNPMPKVEEKADKSTKKK